jgi:hypothetical protein
MNVPTDNSHRPFLYLSLANGWFNFKGGCTGRQLLTFAAALITALSGAVTFLLQHLTWH